MTTTRQLVLGRAGTGKTRFCLDAALEFLCRDKGDMIFLMPNRGMIRYIGHQLLKSGSLSGLRGSNLCVFSDLWGSAGLVDTALPGRLISNCERQLILQDIIDKIDLEYLGNAAAYPGFVRAAGRLIQEFKQNLITPDDVARSTNALPPTKSDDIVRIYRRYEAFLNSNRLLDLQDAARCLLKQLDHDSLQLGLLVVDGFSSFTRLEFELLRKLIQAAGKTVLALCYDPADDAVFESISGTYRRLRSISGWKQVLLDHNRRSTGALAHLEANLFHDHAPQLEADRAIQILRAPTMAREVETVAAEIKKIVVEQGKNFSDLAVLLRSTETYAPLINRIFNRYRIPHYIADTADLQDVPIIRTLRQVLRYLAGDFDRDLFFDLLRNRGFTREQPLASQVQNYALKYGLLTREHFLQQWPPADDYNEDIISGINHCKTALLQLLDRWQRTITPAAEPARYRQLVLDIVRKLIPAEAMPAVPDPEFDFHRKQGRAVNALLSIVENIKNYCAVSGRKNLKPAQFLNLIDRALSDANQTTPPLEKDFVHVCNVFESRLPQYDTVFVMGLQEKLFPKLLRNDPLLKDHERSSDRASVQLPQSAHRSGEERYLFYIAVTRTARKLYLTCHSTGLDGKEVALSHYLDRVADLFTPKSVASATRTIPLGELIPGPGNIVRSRDIHHLIAANLHSSQNRSEALTAALYNAYIKQNKKLRALLAEGLPFRTGEISSAAVALLQKKTYHIGISRLEVYGNCPYRYFIEHVLKIRPREEMAYTPLLEGDLYHKVLDRLMRKIYQQDRTELESLTPRELLSLVEEMVEQHIRSRYSDMFNARRLQPAKTKFLEKLKIFLLKERDNQMRNSTRPEYFELGFSDEHTRVDRDLASTRDALLIDCGDGLAVRLAGRIDRVDLLESSGEKLGVIIDYKRSDRTKGKASFLDGEALQCPVYMIALEKLFGIRAVASFYASIDTGRKRGIYQQELSGPITGDRDTYGEDACPALELKRVLDTTVNYIKDRVKAIHLGRFPIDPKSDHTCRNCPCRLICRR